MDEFQNLNPFGAMQHAVTLGDLTDDLLGVANGILNPWAPVAGTVTTAAADAGLGTAPSSSKSARVTAPDGLNLRSQPNEHSSIVTGLPEGSVVSVIATDLPPTSAAPKGWTQVRSESGKEGYVSTEWLSISSPTSATSGNPVSAAIASFTKSAGDAGESSSTTKLLMYGGGFVALLLAGALVFGGKKKGKKK